MKILVYNNDRRRIETYYRNMSDPMPYSRYKYCSVKEYRGSSNHVTIWTSKYNIESFNKLRQRWNKPIKVGFAFKSVTEMGHSNQSQHYAGLAIDMAQNLSVAKRKELHQLARKTGLYRYVEPITMTPTWIHIDTRATPPACSAGYPVIKRGSANTYVMTLQDALRYKFRYNQIRVDGVFGPVTESAVKSFQRVKGISPTGVVACQTWRAIVG